MKQLEDDCMVRTIATDIAIEAEKDKKEVTLPPEYQKSVLRFPLWTPRHVRRKNPTMMKRPRYGQLRWNMPQK